MRIVATLAAICFALAVSPQGVQAADYQKDAPLTHSLTAYLHNHRLPLVGAEVMKDVSGAHQVVLYGFVATDLGKSNAEAKTRSFLNDPRLQLINRIMVNPQISNLPAPGSNPGGSAPAAAPTEDPISEAYDAFMQQGGQGSTGSVGGLP